MVTAADFETLSLTEIIRLKEAGVKPSEIADRLGINRASMYRLLDGNAGGDRQEVA